MSPPTAQIQIVTVSAIDPNILIVTYNAAVNADDFSETQFHTSPGNLIPQAPGNAAADQIELDFTEIVDGETSLTFSGSVPNVISPQTVELT